MVLSLPLPFLLAVGYCAVMVALALTASCSCAIATNANSGGWFTVLSNRHNRVPSDAETTHFRPGVASSDIVTFGNVFVPVRVGRALALRFDDGICRRTASTRRPTDARRRSRSFRLFHAAIPRIKQSSPLG